MLSVGGGSHDFWFTQNPLFWELGIGARSANFSHAGMTLWDPSGPRTPPKSICTHRHTRLKKIAKKSRFSPTTVHGTLFGPDGLLRSKMVLNMFFGPLSISYDAWMMSHTKFKKLFLRLKIGPKVTFLPKSLLTFYCCKIDLFKGKPPENPRFGTLFQESITFFWRGVRN